MKTVLKYLKRHTITIILVILFLFIQAMCDLALPDYTSKIVDVGISQNGIEDNVPVDMVAIDIKRIWEKLGEILGENYSEELIDQLFSQFCLGK